MTLSPALGLSGHQNTRINEKENEMKRFFQKHGDTIKRVILDLIIGAEIGAVLVGAYAFGYKHGHDDELIKHLMKQNES